MDAKLRPLNLTNAQAVFDNRKRVRDSLENAGSIVEMKNKIKQLEAKITALSAENLALKQRINILAPESSLHVAIVQDVVCKHFGMSLEELLAKRRKQKIIRARHTAIYISKKLTGLSLVAIGFRFRQDHSNVLYADRMVEKKINTDPQFAEMVENLTEQAQSAIWSKELSNLAIQAG